MYTINNEFHKNLKSNVPFDELPVWFKVSITENAIIEFDGRFITWKNGIWIHGIWWDGIWENGIWKNGIWKNGTWLNGIWENGRWHNGTWHNGREHLSRCRWFISVNYKNNEIIIGCESKTVEEWDKWFAGTEEYETKRDSEEFKLIYESYLRFKNNYHDKKII